MSHLPSRRFQLRIPTRGLLPGQAEVPMRVKRLAKGLTRRARYSGPMGRFTTDRERYVHVGIGEVGGWLAHDVVFPLGELADAQKGLGVTGGAAEIGVHHGQLFILLALYLSEHERAVAIDLFEQQGQNIDGSGEGDREILEANMTTAGVDRDRVELITANSLDVAADAIVASLGEPARLFSVDGGHTPELTLNDLQLAHETVAKGGIVILDDAFSPMWPGVIQGLLDYLERPECLKPFALLGNKTLLTHEEFCKPYQDVLVPFTAHLHHRLDNVFGHPVQILRA
ncbi:MAG: class I SAM-dependent methyltransferase [Acidimicrobiales bacterium]